VTQFLSSAALANLQRLLGLAGGDATQNTTLEDSAVQLVQDVGNLSVSSLPGLADNSTFVFTIELFVDGVAMQGFQTLDPYASSFLNGVSTLNLKDFDIWIMSLSAIATGGSANIATVNVYMDVNESTSAIGAAEDLNAIPLANWTSFKDDLTTGGVATDQHEVLKMVRMKWPRNVNGLRLTMDTAADATVLLKAWCELVAPGGRPSAF